MAKGEGEASLPVQAAQHASAEAEQDPTMERNKLNLEILDREIIQKKKSRCEDAPAAGTRAARRPAECLGQNW